MTTTNKPMTGEQLDELMTVAVNMQRDSEKVGERPAAMFAYAVQVAVLELRKVRNDAAALAAENANARNAVQVFCDVVGANTDAICEEIGQDGVRAILAAMNATGNMPTTDSFLAEVRAQGVEMLTADRKSEWMDSYIEDASEFAAQLRKGASA